MNGAVIIDVGLSTAGSVTVVVSCMLAEVCADELPTSV